MNKTKPKGDGKTSCLVCGRTISLTRGLCRTHYQRFLNKKKEIEATGTSSTEWEDEVVRMGFVERRYDKKKIDQDTKDIFQEIADLVAEQKSQFKTKLQTGKKEDKKAQ